MLKAWWPLGTLVIVVAASACRPLTSPGIGTAATSPETEPTDKWLGRWDGPEGTHLQLTKNGDKYLVEIQDLDGPRTFDGFAERARIRFVRNAKTEYLSAGDGRATGMKWLADKKDCLLTRTGEGWCRK